MKGFLPQEVYVVNGQEEALPGIKASSQQKFIHFLYTVPHHTGNEYREQYPELFRDLGKMAGEYKSKLSRNATPVSDQTTIASSLRADGKTARAARYYAAGRNH